MTQHTKWEKVWGNGLQRYKGLQKMKIYQLEMKCWLVKFKFIR